MVSSFKLNLPEVGKAIVDKNIRKFYVHQMLTGFRTDRIPSYSNPRHVYVVEQKKHKSKYVWADVQDQDNTEQDIALATHDCKVIKFDGLDVDSLEIEKTERII